MTYYAVIDAEGNAVSFGDVLADDAHLEENGLSTVEVDEALAQDPNKVWDAASRSFVDRQPTAEEQARESDDAFVANTTEKLRAGKSLTQVERDRLTALSLLRA